MDHDIRHVVFLYKTKDFDGELHSSTEGRVWWMPLSDMPNAPLASSMDDMLQLFLRDDLSEHSFRVEDDQWFSVLE